ncbi:stage V sporulation protein SpoVM [Sporosarcina sp. CAU 1771]
MLNGKEFRCVKGVEKLRVYTFTMPKFLSGFVRKCMHVFQKDEQPKKNTKAKKRKREKTPS